MTLFDPHFQASDSSGNPVSGALLYFTLGGTNTPITTYQDSAFVTPHASPVVADVSGLFAPIYIPPGSSPYKAALYTSANVLIQTIDNITTPVDLATQDQVITGGARITTLDLGTKSSGTLTPDPGDRPAQKVINGGAFTLAPGSVYGSYRLDVTNNASAGAITTSGFTRTSGTFTTTSGQKFMCFVNVSELGSVLDIVAMQ